MTKTRGRTLSDMHIEVEYGLTKIGNQSPYFSVTAKIWKSLNDARRWPDSPSCCGAAHDEVLRAFPDMADIVALHLSDDEGVPMHAEANGWHFYNRGELATAAELLRVTVVDLPIKATREEFASFVESQRDRWGREATEARRKYDI